MKFYLGSSFSYELTNRKNIEPLDKLEVLLNEYFTNKEYGNSLKKIYWTAICVSEQFDQFFLARPPKYSKKELDIQLEYKIDFHIYKSTDDDRRFLYIGDIFLKSMESLLDSKSIKRLDSEIFMSDLRAFWNNQKQISTGWANSRQELDLF